MNPFKKKDKITPEKIVNYSEVDQGRIPPPIVESDDSQLRKVLENQKVIVQNQQVILDSIVATQQLIRSLAGEAEAEPTPEEIRAAVAELKRKRGA